MRKRKAPHRSCTVFRIISTSNLSYNNLDLQQVQMSLELWLLWLWLLLEQPTRTITTTTTAASVTTTHWNYPKLQSARKEMECLWSQVVTQHLKFAGRPHERNLSTPSRVSRIMHTKQLAMAEKKCMQHRITVMALFHDAAIRSALDLNTLRPVWQMHMSDLLQEYRQNDDWKHANDEWAQFSSQHRVLEFFCSYF